MSNLGPVALAVLCGVLLTTQIAANRRLGTAIASPMGAALVSFVVGLIALALCMAVMRRSPSTSGAGSAPWWAWIGGILGATYVASTVYLLPRLGSVLLLGSVIAGQLLAGLVIDQYGWLGVATHPLTPIKLLGATLLVSGVLVLLRA